MTKAPETGLFFCSLRAPSVKAQICVLSAFNVSVYSYTTNTQKRNTREFWRIACDVIRSRQDAPTGSEPRPDGSRREKLKFFKNFLKSRQSRESRESRQSRKVARKSKSRKSGNFSFL